MKLSLRVIAVITFLVFFAASYHAIPVYADQDASKQVGVQVPELVRRDAKGKITHLLSASPMAESKATANPPGYDAIIEQGFPVQTLHTAGSYYSGPVIHTLVGDVNEDGFQEIVVTGTALGPLYMFDYQGNQVPGWPQPLEGAAYPVMQERRVIAAHFGSDNITAYNQNGIVLWQREASNYLANPPSIGYVHSLALEGVFLEEEDNDLHGYRVTDGTPLPGWPARVSVSQFCFTPAIADIDDDGENEFITFSGFTTAGVTVAAFHENGSLVTGWPIQFSNHAVFPVIGDVDGDGAKEVIVIVGYSYVHVYSPAGILKRSWQLSGKDSLTTAPALADINGDGIPEIIVQSDTAIDVTNGFGNPLPGWPLSLGDRWVGNSAPVIGDVDGDGFLEIVFITQVPGSGTNGYVHVVNHDGTYATNFPMPLLIGDGAVPAIADIDLDGHNEIIITGNYWNGYEGYYDKVWVFDLDRDNPSARHGRIEWGQFYNNMRHTNEYGVAPSMPFYVILHRDGAICSLEAGWKLGTPPYYPGSSYAVAIKIIADGSYTILHKDGALWNSVTGWTITTPPYYPGTAYAKDLVTTPSTLASQAGISGNGYPSQDFEATYDSHDIALADDFTTSQSATITSIFIPGYVPDGSLASANALNWQIYANAGGVPAGNPFGGGSAPLWSASLVPTDPHVTVSGNDVTLTLDPPLTLPAGTYWLVFYPQLDFGVAGYYYWFSSTTTNGYTAHFINPGGGSVICPTVWTPVTDGCFGGIDHDLAFRISIETKDTILHKDGALWNSIDGWTITTPPFYPGTDYARALEVRADASYVILHKDGAVYDSAAGWVMTTPPFYPGNAWAVDIKLDGTGYVLLHRDGALWSTSGGWVLSAPPYYPGSDYARGLKQVGSKYIILHKDGAIYDSMDGWYMDTPPYYPGSNYAVDLEVR